MKSKVKFLFAILLLCSSAVFALEVKNVSENDRCRGKYLRTDEMSSQEEVLIDCHMVVRGGIPGIQLKRRIRKTIVGVKVHEALLRTSEPSSITGAPSSIKYVPIPGAEVLGDDVITTEYLDSGICANMMFEVNGKKVASDNEGVILDWPGEENLGILDYFDNQDNLDFTLHISRPGMEDADFTVFRRMPQRPEGDEHRIDEPDDRELLYVFGLNFLQKSGEPQRDKLEISISTRSQVIMPNVPFEIVVQIKNNGQKPTNCLAGRIFARQPWLNGRWFYFGAIPPGMTMSFKRYVVADRKDNVKNVFAELHFRDSFGNLPLLTQKLHFTIE